MSPYVPIWPNLDILWVHVGPCWSLYGLTWPFRGKFWNSSGLPYVTWDPLSSLDPFGGRYLIRVATRAFGVWHSIEKLWFFMHVLASVKVYRQPFTVHKSLCQCETILTRSVIICILARFWNYIHNHWVSKSIEIYHKYAGLFDTALTNFHLP